MLKVDFRDQSIFVRIDPEIGRGHHKHVKTAGTKVMQTKNRHYSLY